MTDANAPRDVRDDELRASALDSIVRQSVDGLIRLRDEWGLSDEEFLARARPIFERALNGPRFQLPPQPPRDEPQRDLVAAIRAALAGITPGEWDWYVHLNAVSGHCYEWIRFIGEDDDQFGPSKKVTESDVALFAAAPGLLREAAARIAADAAVIVTLQDEIARRETLLEIAEMGKTVEFHHREALGVHTWVTGKDVSHVFCVYCNARKENFPDDE